MFKMFIVNLCKEKKYVYNVHFASQEKKNAAYGEVMFQLIFFSLDFPIIQLRGTLKPWYSIGGFERTFFSLLKSEAFLLQISENNLKPP